MPPNQPAPPPARDINTPAGWLKLVFGLSAVFALFLWSADVLSSDRGQAGLIVAALVVAALLAVERVLFGQGGPAAVRSLGLGIPSVTSLAAALGVAMLLWSTIVLFAVLTGLSFRIDPRTLWLAPGLFAQAGIAEESLFRGYLFGHVRRGRSFWHAAGVCMLPFVAVHLVLFLTMPWPVAAAALGLSVALSFPLAHLWELGGGTIWGAALLHFVVQGTVKVVTVDGAGLAFPLTWMVVSALVPLLILLLPRPRAEREDSDLRRVPGR